MESDIELQSVQQLRDDGGGIEWSGSAAAAGRAGRGSFPRAGGAGDPLSVVWTQRGSEASPTSTLTTTGIDLRRPSPTLQADYRPVATPLLGIRGGPVEHPQAVSTYYGEHPPPVTSEPPGAGASLSMCSTGKQCALACGAVLAALILSFVLIGISLQKLEVYEVGVKYHTIRKELEREPQQEGLHLGEPGFEFVVFPSIFKTLSWGEFRCVNFDGVDVNIAMGFQYKVNPQNLRPIILEFKDYEGYVVMVRNMADTVIHETCSKFGTDSLQTNRTHFQETMRSLMTHRLGTEISTIITDLQVDNINRPRDYEKAIRDKEAAKESIEVALNERPRQLTSANTEKQAAITQGTIQMNRAEAGARSIIAKASAEAEGIKYSYEKEATAYRRIMDDLSLDVEGLLAYLSSQIISAAERPLVNIDAPARSQYPGIAQ